MNFCGPIETPAHVAHLPGLVTRSELDKHEFVAIPIEDDTIEVSSTWIDGTLVVAARRSAEFMTLGFAFLTGDDGVNWMATSIVMPSILRKPFYRPAVSAEIWTAALLGGMLGKGEPTPFSNTLGLYIESASALRPAAVSS